MTESEEQRVLAQWLDLNHICWAHVPNGRLRNPIVGAFLKAEGVKRGLPDVLIFDPPPMQAHLHGAALELKSEGGRATPEQRAWLEALAERGWATHIVVGATAAIEYLTRCLGYGARANRHRKQGEP